MPKHNTRNHNHTPMKSVDAANVPSSTAKKHVKALLHQIGASNHDHEDDVNNSHHNQLGDTPDQHHHDFL